MSITLPALPFEKKALEPHISARTLEFHHGKHHQAYVEKVNGLIEGTELADRPLEEIIRASAGRQEMAGIFNNAAQVWNHTFYWQCIQPGGGGKPAGELAGAIDASFGDFAKFRQSLKDAGLGQFGSGWAWLVRREGKLEIVKTANADTPLVHGALPLLVIDVWEHAYYLDYQNRRGEYLDAFLEHLVNWDFVQANLG